MTHPIINAIKTEWGHLMKSREIHFSLICGENIIEKN